MTFTLVIYEEETNKLKSTVTNVENIRHVNTKEIAFTEHGGRRRSIAFYEDQRLEVLHR